MRFMILIKVWSDGIWIYMYMNHNVIWKVEGKDILLVLFLFSFLLHTALI